MSLSILMQNIKGKLFSLRFYRLLADIKLACERSIIITDHSSAIAFSFSYGAYLGLQTYEYAN